MVRDSEWWWVMVRYCKSWWGIVRNCGRDMMGDLCWDTCMGSDGVWWWEIVTNGDKWCLMLNEVAQTLSAKQCTHQPFHFNCKKIDLRNFTLNLTDFLGQSTLHQIYNKWDGWVSWIAPASTCRWDRCDLIWLSEWAQLHGSMLTRR